MSPQVPVVAGQGSCSLWHRPLPLAALFTWAFIASVLQGLGDNFVGYGPRENSHFFFFSHLEPFTYFFFTSYWFLLGFAHLFFQQYLTLVIPIMNLLTYFVQPLPHFGLLPFQVPPARSGILCPHQMFLPVPAEHSGPIFHILPKNKKPETA